VHLTQTLFQLIDMRSFSNLWYWIVLAVSWSSMTHWVLGVPHDLIMRARRRGGVAGEDMVGLLQIHLRRILFIGSEGGMVLTLFVSFLLTTLALTGFIYRVEFSQALFLILFPFTLAGLLSLRAAGRISALISAGETGVERLSDALLRHRLHVQLLGMLAITVTALWGMLQNLSFSVLGG
jgi:hypothetical protein